ncbi:MAG: 2-dehydropantoate 2-reductase N-terminal domain-containing protein, partial [Chromatocurvus sp.]
MRPDHDHAHWHVLGAGAIGSLFAHRLAATGCDVTLLSRGADERPRALVLESGPTVSQRVFAVSPCAALAPIHYLLVTTKAADVDPAIASVSHRVNAHSTVLVLANGMGFAGDLPHDLTAFRGTTTDGAFRRPAPAATSRGDTHHTVHAGSGETRIGLPGSAVPAPDWYKRSWGQLQDCRWDRQIETTLWRKLAINCVINPLTATYRCRNGALAAPAYQPLLRAVCDEVTAACRAAGRGMAVGTLWQDVLQVVDRTAANRS